MPTSTERHSQPSRGRPLHRLFTASCTGLTHTRMFPRAGGLSSARHTECSLESSVTALGKQHRPREQWPNGLLLQLEACLQGHLHRAGILPVGLAPGPLLHGGARAVHVVELAARQLGHVGETAVRRLVQPLAVIAVWLGCHSCTTRPMSAGLWLLLLLACSWARACLRASGAGMPSTQEPASDWRDACGEVCGDQAAGTHVGLPLRWPTPAPSHAELSPSLPRQARYRAYLPSTGCPCWAGGPPWSSHADSAPQPSAHRCLSASRADADAVVLHASSLSPPPCLVCGTSF